MSKPAIKLDLRVEAHPKGGFLVRGNKQVVRTPNGADLLLPTEALANALCDEIKLHGKKGYLYRLSAMLADIIVPQAAQAQEEMRGFLETDMVLYRADTPDDLVAWESEHWDAVLHWAEQNGFGKLPTTAGLSALTLPEQAHQRLDTLLKGFSHANLLTCLMATRLAGSVLAGLMFTVGALDDKQLYTIAAADELYQMKRYSKPVDTQIQALQRLENSLREIAHFRALSGVAIPAK